MFSVFVFFLQEDKLAFVQRQHMEEPPTGDADSQL